MTHDEFIAGGKRFILMLLRAVCTDVAQIEVAGWRAGERTFFAAKLSGADDEAIRFSDTYVALKKVVARAGAVRRDPDGKAFEASFRLFDQSMAAAQFEVPPEHEF